MSFWKIWRTFKDEVKCLKMDLLFFQESLKIFEENLRIFDKTLEKI